MHTITQVNTAKVQQTLTNHETTTNFYQILRHRRIIMTTGKKRVKRLNVKNLMQQLSNRIIYFRSHRPNIGKVTKTEDNEKTEFGMFESVYTIPSPKTNKSRKHSTTKKKMSQNKHITKYKNIHEYGNCKTSNLIKNKLTSNKKRKLARKAKRIIHMVRKLKSIKKMLAENKKYTFTNEFIDLFNRFVRCKHQKVIKGKSDYNELQVLPVEIVPPLPLPVWAKAMNESPDLVTLRSSPSVPNAAVKRRLMNRRSKQRHRKHKHCVIHAQSLTKAVNSEKWNKGIRKVSAATFRATRVHYRYLLAKYGKQRLMERQRG